MSQFPISKHLLSGATLLPTPYYMFLQKLNDLFFWRYLGLNLGLHLYVFKLEYEGKKEMSSYGLMMAPGLS
jgi:hypothetical protein